MPYPINSLTRPNSGGKDLLAYIYDLSPLDLHLLIILLQAKKPLTLEKLAAKIDRDKSTVFRSVQKMAALGLCIKEAMSLKEGGYYHIYSADIGTISKNTKQRIQDIRSSLDNILEKFDDDLNTIVAAEPAKLRAAVEKALATLGESTKKALMHELKESGVSFDSSCSLNEIENVLKRMVGDGMALKIIQDIRTTLLLNKQS